METVGLVREKKHIISESRDLVLDLPNKKALDIRIQQNLAQIGFECEDEE